MLSKHAKATIDEMVRESMFGIIKMKTGISQTSQIKNLEFLTTFKKEEGVIKISCIYLKNKLLSDFERITFKDIKFSGATSNEFITYLRNSGASQIEDKKHVLEKI